MMHAPCRLRLRHFMPMETIQITVNALPHEVRAGSTLQDWLCAQSLETRRLAIERNGAIVPRSAYASTLLEAGDCLEVVVAVGGG